MAGGELCADINVPIFSENCCSSEELMWECCLKLKSELQEMRIELKSAMAIINILKEGLISCSNLMHHFFITFITILYMFRAPLFSSSGGFIVYIQHLVLCMSLWNSTIDQLKSNVPTNNRFEELSNRKGTIDWNVVDISPKLNGANINQLQYNNLHSKARKSAQDNGMPNKRGNNSCKLPSHLPNLQKQASGPKKLHDTDMNLNYAVPVLVNGKSPQVKVKRRVL